MNRFQTSHNNKITENITWSKKKGISSNHNDYKFIIK